MTQQMLPTFRAPKDYILAIAYEGPSFNGQINLHNLTEELAGFEYCLEAILSAAYRGKIIPINPLKIELIVEAFEKGSFRKKIKARIEGLENHPVLAMVVMNAGLIFTGIAQIIVSHSSNDIKELSPQIMKQIGDSVKIELLADPDFLKSYAKVVGPLQEEGDSIRMVKADDSEYVINHEDKSKFQDLVSDDMELTTEIQEILIGRVTRVDLTATKNALGFKVGDSGPTVVASFLDPIGADERKNLLDKWIEIRGITSKTEKERKHITIYSYKVIDLPEQGTINFDDSEPNGKNQ